MSQNVYGYVRVSTKNQNEDRQMLAMEEFGIKPANIIVEKMSGKDFERPAYKKLEKKLKQGDVLVIKSIDRLGRNYSEILEHWTLLTKKRKVAIVVLDMPLLDTRARNENDLIGTLVADIVLQLLGYVAQQERELIHQRQMEGIAAAKRKGVHFGRERIQINTEQFEKLVKEWWRGRITANQAGQEMGISRNTFSRRAKEWCKKEGLDLNLRATFGNVR